MSCSAWAAQVDRRRVVVAVFCSHGWLLIAISRRRSLSGPSNARIPVAAARFFWPSPATSTTLPVRRSQKLICYCPSHPRVAEKRPKLSLETNYMNTNFLHDTCHADGLEPPASSLPPSGTVRRG